MAFVFLYLTTLFIAPQLWLEPLVGTRVDLYLYPAWLGWIAMTGRVRELFRFGVQDYFFIGMLVWIVVTLAVNGFQANSSDLIQDYLKWFVLYRLVIVSVPSMIELRRTSFLLLGFALILALEGIQHMHDPTGLGWVGQEFAWMDEEAVKAGVRGRTRWIGIFDGPGVFCVAYTIALPYAMQYLARPFGASAKLVGMLLLFPLLVATYYTGSRGGFLATIGVFALYLVTKLRLSMPRLLMVGSVVILAILLGPRHLTSTRDSHGSAQHRVDMWAEGIEMVQQNPVFGIGKGNFLRYTNKLVAHNSAIEIMGETGLPGLFLWVGVIYMGFKNVYRYCRETGNAVHSSYGMALGLSVAGYMISSMFVTLEYETFYFLLALTAVVGNSLAAPPTFSERDFWTMSGLMFMFILSVKVFVMLYY